MATDHYSPSTLTSVKAIIITQTLKGPGNPPTPGTSRLTTTLTLIKPPPTGVGRSNSQAHSARLPTSTVGAIVGSILGFIVLLVLILYCCRSASSEDTYSDSEGFPEPERHKRPPVSTVGRSNTAGGLKIGRVVKSKKVARPRPSRRKRRPPMNEAHREPQDLNPPYATLVWLAGGRRFDPTRNIVPSLQDTDVEP